MQVQGEESFYWDAYKATITSFYEGSIELLKRHEQLALWLQTDSGLRWWDDHGEERDSAINAPIHVEDVGRHLWEYAWRTADEYENKRIRQFLNDRYLRSIL